MEQNNDDAGLQFVLDNRRLILAFGLLVVLCGGFFVLGFVEGRRQASSGPATAVIPPAGQGAGSADRMSPAKAEPGSPRTPDDKAVRERLDWYSQVGGTSRTKGTAPAAGEEVHRSSAPSAAAAGSAASTPPAGAPPASRPTSYTVQVGAFRQRKEAEAKAAVLKSKGYDYTIEAPAAPDQLFLLKVGRFSSKTEAVALQVRLRRDGFSTFIKTN